MMKTNNCIAALLILATAVIACRKEIDTPVVSDDFGAGEKMVFKAYASPVSKSHFESSDEYTENEGTLYWDATDQVGIMSIYLHDEGESFASKFDAYWPTLAAGYGAGSRIERKVDKYITSSLATVVPDADPSTSGTLYSNLPKAEWFANSDEAIEGKKAYYDFFGIYPMSSEPELWIVAKSDDGDPILGVPVDVSSGQWSDSGFGRYHVCVDCGVDPEAEDSGLYAIQDILAGTKQVSFENFSPLTSLLQFKIKSDSDTPVLLNSVNIRTENSSVILAGRAYVISSASVKYLFPDRWYGYLSSSVYLNLYDNQTGTYPEITTSETAETYSIVVFPSYKRGLPVGDGLYASAPSFCSSYGGETLIFEGYDVMGDKVFEATKTIPEYGFEPGKRYVFTLDFKTRDRHLPGKYSVSAGKAVSFSCGNLLYEGAGWWNSQRYSFWRFYNEQYDHMYVDESSTHSMTEYSDVDRFGWATAGVQNNAGDYGADAHHVAYRMWAYSTDYSLYGPSRETLPGGTSWTGHACEPYCEWGRNPELVSRLGEGWRTLSREEWEYLLFTRPASTVNGVPNARYCKGTYYGRTGLFIFSDTFGSDYSGDQSVFGNVINQPAASFGTVQLYGIDDLVQAGLVFLPITGLRSGLTFEDTSSLGVYWSSTPADDWADAYALHFDSSEIVVERFEKSCGLCVRLVQDVDPSLSSGAGNAGEYTEKPW